MKETMKDIILNASVQMTEVAIKQILSYQRGNDVFLIVLVLFVF